MAMTVAVMSCRTKDGEPGPAGVSDLSKQGVMSGTLSYVDNDGNPLKESFSYEYYETLLDAYYKNTDDNSYTLSFSRRDLKDYQKDFKFTLYGNTDQSGNPLTPQEGDLRFSYLSVNGNNLFSFNISGGSGGSIYFGSESSTTCNISNFSYNEATGRLVFDYNISVYPYDIVDRYDSDTYAQIDGHVDVVVLYKKEPQQPA